MGRKLMIFVLCDLVAEYVLLNYVGRVEAASLLGGIAYCVIALLVCISLADNDNYVCTFQTLVLSVIFGFILIFMGLKDNYGKMAALCFIAALPIVLVEYFMLAWANKKEGSLI